MKKRQKVVIAGGSGFIGQALVPYLHQANYDVVVLSRYPKKHLDHDYQEVGWDGKTLGDWTKELEGAKALINLTGKNVNCVFNEENKKLILASRIESISTLSHAVHECTQPPECWIQAGGIACYGNTGNKVCTEDSRPQLDGFLSKVCKLWEEAFKDVPLPQTRSIQLRIGFVLSNHGGSLPVLKKLVKNFLGGTVGSGKQYISWVHIHDLCEMILWLMEDPHLEGAFNVTSSEPLKNKDFMKAMRNKMGRPWTPPAPAIFVKVGSRFLLNTNSELALTGQKALPQRALQEGFQFKYPDLDSTLNQLI